MILSKFLIEECKRNQIDQLYGIPGDFVLDLFDRFSESKILKIVRLSHEPGIGFAAQAAARATKKPTICCVTYGVGALNTINPVACAYAEKVPLIVISGGPGKKEKTLNLGVHHQVKEINSQLKIFKELTQESYILDDPDQVARQIRRAFMAAKTFLKPVYLEVPRDMVDVEIHVPKDLDKEIFFPIDENAARECAEEIFSHLSQASNPTLMVGVEVLRMDLTSQVVSLAEKMGIRVVTSFLGKGGFPLDHPQYLGSYCGPVSPPEVSAAVEKSDFLLMLGVLMTDTNMGLRIRALPVEQMVLAVDRTVTIQHHQFPNVPLDILLKHLRLVFETHAKRQLEEPTNLSVGEVVKGFHNYLLKHGHIPIVTDTGQRMDLKAVSEMQFQVMPAEQIIECVDGRVTIQSQMMFAPPAPELVKPKHPLTFKMPASSKPITVQQVVDSLDWFLFEHGQMPVVVDTGDVLLASYEMHAEELYGTPYYATMGFAVPSALGVEISTGRRPLVLVGDGAFQMTGHEISWAPYYKLKPIVVVFNNAAWEMLKGFHGKSQTDDIISWPYAKLAEDWGGKGYDIKTVDQLTKSLLDAKSQNCFTILDVHLQKGDITRTLKTFAEQIIKGRR